MWQTTNPVRPRAFSVASEWLPVKSARVQVIEFPGSLHSFDEGTVERRDGLGCVMALRLAIAFDLAFFVIIIWRGRAIPLITTGWDHRGRSRRDGCYLIVSVTSSKAELWLAIPDPPI